MNLTELKSMFPGEEWACSLTEDKEIKALAYNSDKVTPGSMFFALKGHRTDGERYIRQAVSNGACVIAAERGADLEKAKAEADGNATVLTFENLRRAMARIAAAFYGEPSKELLTVGITGTKGKTGTAFMIRKVLEKAGIRTGIIGTVFDGYGESLTEAGHTTPESVDLQRMLRQMADGGCRAVVMEVSSQGLKYSRADNVDFDIGVFTNLSPDHTGPGEHESYEEYRYWKSTLFARCPALVMNGDDRETPFMLGHASTDRTVLYGAGEDCDFRFQSCLPWRKGGMLGIEYVMRAEKPCGDGSSRRIRIPLAGSFNAYNSAAAIAVTKSLGAPWSDIEEALAETVIPGRCQIIPVPGRFTAVVDYAHNGVALENLLRALREYRPNALRVVFGCGGERAKERRVEMGRAASRWADEIILTTDNPRSEDPESIIRDIISGIADREKITVIEDRRKAIRTALARGKEGDIVAIAGKGHETCQLIGGEKHFFDDRKEVEDFGKERE